MPDQSMSEFGHRDWRLRVRDAIEALEQIDRFVQEVTYEEFIESLESLQASERNVGIVGSAISSIPEEVREQDPTVPWEEVVSLRYTVLHEYWLPTIPKEIWQTVIENRLRLRDALVATLEEGSDSVR